MLEDSSTVPVKNENLPVKTPKVKSKSAVSHQLTANVTESEFKLYSSLAVTLCNQKLIKEPSMYYFLKYAARFLTDFVLAIAIQAQNKARAAQNARRGE